MTRLDRLVLILALAFPATGLASPVLFDLRADEIEDIDEVNSFDLLRGGITATLIATPPTFNEPPSRELLLNRTASAFGVNVENTSCGSSESSSLLDDGCVGEAIDVTFDFDVFLNEFKVSSFGADVGRADIVGAPSIDILNTGIHSLGDTFLAAGDALSIVFVSGNGFSFDNFSVMRAPIPATSLLFGFVVGLLPLRSRRS